MIVTAFVAGVITGVCLTVGAGVVLAAAAYWYEDRAQAQAEPLRYYRPEEHDGESW